MSLYHYLKEKHPQALKTFLDETGELAVAVLDADRRVIAHNQQFAQRISVERPEGKQLLELIDPMEGESVVLPPPESHWNVNVQCKHSSHRNNQYTIQAFNTNGQYVLFFDNPAAQNDSVASRMAALNEELTNLTRELQKKNRDLERANDTIERISRTDALTELPNRRHFEEEFEGVLSAAERHQFPVALAIADLDHFKKVNDTYGHKTGDEVLKSFADVLKSCCRTEDVAVRWGGEEFILLMPHTTAEGGKKMAERARQTFQETSSPGVNRPITVSFGVTQYGESDEAKDVIARADKALYRAKADGRNRVNLITPGCK